MMIWGSDNELKLKISKCDHLISEGLKEFSINFIIFLEGTKLTRSSSMEILVVTSDEPLKSSENAPSF